MITRAATKENALMSLVNSIGNSIDEKSAKANIYNLHYQGLLSDKAGRIMMSVVSDNNFKGVETEIKNQIRASLLKQRRYLLCVVNIVIKMKQLLLLKEI